MTKRTAPLPPHLAKRVWKPGVSGNPKGRPKGAKNTIRDWKVYHINETGMTPLDFLTAVYRDEVYTKFDRHVGADGRSFYFTKAKGAKRIPAGLKERLTAAANAAVYVHKRMPVGVEVSDPSGKLITADQLAKLSDKEITALLTIMNKLNIVPEVAVPGLTFTQDGGAAHGA